MKTCYLCRVSGCKEDFVKWHDPDDPPHWHWICLEREGELEVEDEIAESLARRTEQKEKKEGI